MAMRFFQRLTILIFLSAFISDKGVAQEMLMLMSGKKIPSKNVKLEDNIISYQHELKNPDRHRKISADRVFAIVMPDGGERVLYKPDSMSQDEPTVEEVRHFVLGQQDALQYFKTAPVSISATALGVSSAFLGFYGLAVPPLYSTIIGGVSPNVAKQKVRDKILLQNEAYVAGYEKKGRDMKIRRSLLYGTCGFAAGLVTYISVYK
jgi:hypothetical protein